METLRAAQVVSPRLMWNADPKAATERMASWRCEPHLDFANMSKNVQFRQIMETIDTSFVGKCWQFTPPMPDGSQVEEILDIVQPILGLYDPSSRTPDQRASWSEPAWATPTAPPRAKRSAPPHYI